MCRYASVYWIFLCTSFKCAACFKVLVYFKTIQPKVQTWWSGKFEAGAAALSRKERERNGFCDGEIRARVQLRRRPSVRGGGRRKGALLNKGTGRGEASRGAGLGAFPCQRAHLTVTLMEDGDVPKSPAGIWRPAR